MANNFLTTDLISNVTLAEFVNNNPFIHTASRGLEGDFEMSSYRIGDSVNIRKQNHFNVNDGQVAVIQSVIEDFETLTIDHQYNVTIEYTSRDLTLKIDRFKERYIDPAIQHLVNKMEFDLAIQASQELNFFEGTAGTPINSFAAFDVAGTKLLEQGVNLSDKAYGALSVRDGGALKSSLQNAFNPTLNEEISLHSALGRLSYFDVFQSQNIARQVAGAPGAGPITTTAIVASGNTIPMAGLTPTTLVFRGGDIFSTEGTESINPLNFQPTGQNMQFVVTADVTSDGGGLATVPVAPTIISDPSNPRRNINQAIPAATVITPVPSHTVNVCYVERGLDIVCPPMDRLDIPYSKVVTDRDANVSIRLNKAGDILQDVNVLRLDVLCGFKWHPQYAIRLIS